MSKGFVWFCQNNTSSDYVRCSIELAKSIKRHNKENKICVITVEQTKFTSQYVDVVRTVKKDESADHKIKWANEYKAFQLTPFTHTIKLEADMLWTDNTDWWWHYLCQHDLVFSVDCKNYKDSTIKDVRYRQLFLRNNLPNIYNGLSYFRKSIMAQTFYQTCEAITKNWIEIRNTCLINCHDEYPSTDVVYALAYRILDPTNKQLIDFPWFKFIHHKPAINGVERLRDQNNYLIPMRIKDKIVVGSQRINRVWHYVDKKMTEALDVRTF